MISGVEGDTVSVLGTADKDESISIIGALYSSDNKLVECIIEPQEVNTNITFEKQLKFKNNAADYTVRVFIWNSAAGMTPTLGSTAEYVPQK